MRVYLIAGEASGDLHGSNLVKALKTLHPACSFRGLGGDLMQSAGVDIVRHYREMAFMGFSEVIQNLKTIMAMMKECRRDIAAYKPDVVVLIDYPGFNLRMAGYTHKAGIPTVYYISPQVWAWKKSRIRQIRQDVDLMLTILPFEKSFYHKHGYSAEWVGHPLLDVIHNYQPVALTEILPGNHPGGKPLIALLPGSRRQEIKTMLPIMARMPAFFPDYDFVIAAAPSMDEDFINQHTAGEKIPIIKGHTYDILAHARAALVTSGTASLETALWEVPQVICYKGSALSYHIARWLVDIPFIGLPNLVMDKPLVKELIQYDFNATNLREELSRLLTDNVYSCRMREEYRMLKEKLGGRGASENAARKILGLLNQ